MERAIQYARPGQVAQPGPGGLCLGIPNAVQILGTAYASFSDRLRDNAPLFEGHMQAVIRRGSNGIDSLKSNTLADTIVP